MRNVEMLISKANRIGAFFAAMPDHNEGIEGIADHIQKFWDPRMRTALLDFLAANPEGQLGSVTLSDIVLEALRTHRQRLTPAQG